MAKKTFSSKLWRDLTSDENRDYKMRIGSTLASSLFGFICGTLVSSIIWYAALNYIIADAVKEISGQ
jgi:hypothetical protein